ncbi:MAG: D-alanyl-D-alanine carboxypeptidase/D-alanyl-D-alanine-endopeptidase [Cyanobacteria bacterium J06588_4]
MKLVFAYLRWLSLFCCLAANPFWFKGMLAEENRAKPALENLDKQPKKICDRDLDQAIAQVINRPQLKRSRWGIEVQTLAGDSLYSLDGDKFFNPASAAKLLVSAAGILELGAQYRIETPIYSGGTPPVLDSLRLKGQGDPTISSQSLKYIVHQLQDKGIKRIENLIIDDSYFAPPAINPTWEWVDVHSYFATAANSTILNQNTVTLTLLPQEIGQPVKFWWNDAIAASQWQVINQATTGETDIEYAVEIDGDLGKPLLKLRGELAVNERPDVWDLAVVDPAQYFLETLRLYLSQGGIKVDRGIVVEQQETYVDTKLTAIDAPPLSKILAGINQESNNLYAEVLGKILAQKMQVDTSIDAVNQTLERLGIDSENYVLIDTSGLSRQNLVTPQTLVAVLQLMSQDSDYRESLAVAGTSGTLKRRFVDTPIQGKLWAKTGTLTGVGALSGYLQTQHRGLLAFSVLVNNSELEHREIRRAIDEIVVILNRLQQC